MVVAVMDKARLARAFFLGLTLFAGPAMSAAPTAAALVVDASDVDRFFAVFHAADGHPGAAQLQAGYLDLGSVALHDCVWLR